jgi:hypothetical protein
MALGFQRPGAGANSKSSEKALGLFLDGMPPENAGLGRKTLRLEVMSKDLRTPLLTSDRGIRLFFCPDLSGNPGDVPLLPGRPLNWYYYWADNVGGPCDYKWKPPEDPKWMGYNYEADWASGMEKCWAYYNPDTDRVQFNSKNTNPSQRPIPYMLDGFSFSFSCTTGNWVAAWNVNNATDLANVVCAHERTHRLCVRYLREPHGAGAWNAPAGWNPFALVGPLHPLDPDRDCVPGTDATAAPGDSQWEQPVVGLSVKSRDSVGFPGRYSGQNPFRDNELYAWVCAVYQQKFRDLKNDTFFIRVPRANYYGEAPAASDRDKDWSVLGGNWRKE